MLTPYSRQGQSCIFIRSSDDFIEGMVNDAMKIHRGVYAVLAALMFIDGENNESKHEKFMPAWSGFIADKPNHNIKKFCAHLSLSVSAIRRLLT